MELLVLAALALLALAAGVFGADVEVLAPQLRRKAVAGHHAAAAKVYSK